MQLEPKAVVAGRKFLALLVLALTFSLPQFLRAQVCTGNVTLDSQADIDGFSCTSVTGDLTIQEAISGDITNLNGLSALTSVDRHLRIASNSALTNVDGLSSLTSVLDFTIISNGALTNIDGLAALTFLFPLAIISNGALTNIDGLAALTRLGTLTIRSNGALTNIDGLAAVTSVRGVLDIDSNSALTNIDGLAALTSVARDLYLINNSALVRCCGLYPLLSSGTIDGSITITGNGAGCTQSDIIAGGPCHPLVANAGADQAICAGASAQIGGSPTASGGVAPFTYSWSPSTGLDNASFSKPTASPSVTTTYTVTVTDASGGTDTDQVTVTITTQPTIANAGGDLGICAPLTSFGTALHANTPTVGTGVWSIVTGTGGSFNNANNPSAIFSGNAGSYELKWTISNPPCPASEDLVTVSFSQLTVLANAGPDQSVCGTSATLAASPTSGQWSKVSGSGGSFANALDPNTTFTGAAGVTYRLQWFYPNGDCSNSDEVQITFKATPSANAGSDKNVTSGQSVQIGGSPTASGGASPFSYSWTPTTGLDDASASNPNASPTSTTEYTVIVTDASGCSASDKVLVNVAGALIANASADQAICAGSSAQIGGSPTASGGVTPFTYSWSPSTGLNNASVANPTASPSATTTYTVQVTDDNGATASDEVVVTVNPLPSVSFNPVGPFNVSDPAVDLSSAVSPAGGSFSGPGVSGNMFNPSAAGVGTHTITYSYTDGNSCTNSASQQVQVNGPAIPLGLVFVADEFIHLEKHGPSEGDMHSNDEIQLKKGKPSTYSGNMTAVDDIKIETKNTVNGNVTSGHTVTIQSGATVNGTVTEHASVASVPLPNPSFSAGGANHTVPQNGSLSLSPGSYGNVMVGKNATLTLGAGTYYFNALDTDVKAKLSLNLSGGPIEINVVNRLTFNKEVKVILSSGDAGSNEVTFTTLQESRLTISEKARVLGNIIASDAAVTLAKNSRFKGTLWAQEILVQQGAVFLPHGSPVILPTRIDSDEIEDIDASAGSASGEQIADAASLRITDYALAQNYPNPFNPSTTIGFALPEAGNVTLKIYTITGQLVRTLVSGNFSGGRHELVWDAKDDRGAQVATGMYFYQLVAHRQNGEAPFTQTRRTVLMK